MLAELSIVPLGRGEHLSDALAEILDVVDRSGIRYKFTPCGTCLEGEWDEVFAVVRKCYERMKKDCNRISCSIKIDYRKGHAGRLVTKVASIEKQWKRAVKQ